MPKLTIADLKKIKEKQHATFALREGGNRAKVTIHMGTCGIAAGARNIMSALMEEIDQSKVEDVITTTSGCAGFCAREPMITIEILDQPPVKYGDLTQDKVREIFKEHIIGGKAIEKYALVVGSESTY